MHFMNYFMISNNNEIMRILKFYSMKKAMGMLWYNKLSIWNRFLSTEMSEIWKWAAWYDGFAWQQRTFEWWVFLLHLVVLLEENIIFWKILTTNSPPGSVIAKIQSLKYICFKRLKEYFLYEHAKPIVWYCR